MAGPKSSSDEPANPHDTDPAIADTAHSEPGSDRERDARARRPSESALSATKSRASRAVAVGDVVGRRYALEEEIGEGGMATVYRARDRELRRDVAVKVLFQHLARREEVVRRFHREARAAAGLEHPNILRIYDVGGAEADDPPFIVMELVRGRSLLGELEQRGPILAEVVACIGALLADALGAAHGKGIIHRDVKPANVLIAPGGKLLLADFGVARLETEDSSLVTKTGALLGTPAYMSPEQAGGDTATARSDLYSLGATLYQLSTGQLPYSGNPAKVLAAIATGSMIPAVRRRAAVGPDLSRLIDRLMATDATKRPQDAATIAAELRALAAAGGLGDPNDELAAYFEAPDEFLKTKTTTVVTAIVSAARSALDEAKLPRAMALADRASALAPEDPDVSALVQTVTEGGRSSNRKRVLGFAAIGVLVAGGATVAAVKLAGSPEPVGSIVIDAAQALANDAAALEPMHVATSDDATSPTPPTTPIDAAVVMTVDDATPPSSLDAPRAIARADAGRPMSAIDAGVAAIDAVVAIDAAPLVAIDAPAAPEKGRIVVENDTWCDVKIDGAPSGRINRRGTIEAPVGRHTVVCEQTGIIGMTWTRDVEVVGGRSTIAKGTMLAEVEITIAVGGPKLQIDRIHYPNGSKAKLKPGRYRAVVEGRAAGYLTIPRVPACTVREVGNDLVCDP